MRVKKEKLKGLDTQDSENQKAFNTIIDSLEGLDRDQQHKILALVVRFFDFNLQNSY